MYGGILRVQMLGATLVGYADDVAIVVTGKDWEGVKVRMHGALERILVWLEENRLEMALEKTEVVALKYGERKREGTIAVANKEVEISQNVKYLGVWLDSSVSFGPHIRAVTARALKTVTDLSRLIPNIGGPGEAKRRVLGVVANSIVLYGGPIWAESLNVGAYRRLLQGVQRKMALQVCRGYKTVSYDAAVVIASMIPIHLVAKERKIIWELDQRTEQLNSDERKATMRMWQNEWDGSSKGRWTRRLIQDVVAWTERKHGTVDYYLTQWLTNHGSFKAYIKRIGKSEDDRCEHCDEEDTAEHVVYGCQRWERDRADLNNKLGVEISVENTIELMLRSSENWLAIGNMIKKIMSAKEIEGRC